VNYEDLIHNPDAELKTVFHFLNFTFDREFLNFFRNNRVARTASALQVKEPLQKDANAAWRRYAAFLPNQ